MTAPSGAPTICRRPLDEHVYPRLQELVQALERVERLPSDREPRVHATAAAVETLLLAATARLSEVR